MKEKTKETLFYIFSIVLVIAVIIVTRFFNNSYFMIPVALIIFGAIYAVIWKREHNKSRANIDDLYKEGILRREKK